jgi:hypothetical protein
MVKFPAIAILAGLVTLSSVAVGSATLNLNQNLSQSKGSGRSKRSRKLWVIAINCSPNASPYSMHFLPLLSNTSTGLAL